MKSWIPVMLALVAMGATGCDKPALDECQKACWNYNKVMFWDKVEKDVEGLSPQDAAKLRAEREKIYKEIETREEDPGLLNCITSCQHDSNKQAVACMQTATTADAMKSCMEM